MLWRYALSIAAALSAVGAIWLVVAQRVSRPELLSSSAPSAQSDVQRPTSATPSAPFSDTHGRDAREVPNAAPAEEGRRAVDSTAVLAGTSRGRLVYEAKLEPVPDALVAAGRRNATTAADGSFDVGVNLDELNELTIVNVTPQGSVHEVSRASWIRADGVWIVPLAIGPTYRAKLLDAPAELEWQGRIVHGDHEEPWTPLHRGPLPYLRYDAPFDPSSEDEAWSLKVRSLDGTREGSAATDGTNGVHEVVVACRERAALIGRLVDERGSPWPGFPMAAVFVTAGGVERVSALTETDGSFRFSSSEPGRVEIVLASPSETAPRKLRFEVPRGLTRVPDLVVHAGGTIAGKVRSVSGQLVGGAVRLRALDGSGLEMRTDLVEAIRPVVKTSRMSQRKANTPAPAVPRVLWTEAGAGARERPFRFDHVPPGRFELSVDVSESPCSPRSLNVQAPAYDCDFTCDDRATALAYRLEVLDEQTGAQLDATLVVSRGSETTRNDHVRGNRTLLRLADGVRFDWFATAPGHRVMHGNERGFVRNGNFLTATCVLSRGFCARLVLDDWSHRLQQAPRSSGGLTVSWSNAGVGGVQVLADGTLVATSDENGIADVDLAAEPRSIEVRLDGWRVVESRDLVEGRVTSFPANVLLVRE